jgi:transcriptional regulator with XRE-family HTH domain
MMVLNSTQEPGMRLREARLRQGLELSEVEARLKIRTKYLRALEWGRLDLLPDEETARRALRAYAECLRLDAELPAEELDESIDARQTPAEQAVTPRRMIPSRTTLAVLIPAVPVAILTPLVLLLQGGPAHKPTVPASRPVGSPAARAVPSRASTVRPVPRAPRSAKPKRRSAPQTRAAKVAPRRARLQIVASRGESWVMVRANSARGRVLFAGTLRQGRSLRVQRARLWLRLGAASNVELRVNGERPRGALYGTFDAMVTSAGLRKVPLDAGPFAP